MKVRKISIACYKRNPAFWILRQERGEEIHLTHLGQFAGILYGAPYPEHPAETMSLRERRHEIKFSSRSFLR